MDRARFGSCKNWIEPDLDCARSVLCKIWIVQDLDHARIGLSKILIVQDLYCVRFGSCKICIMQEFDWARLGIYKICIFQNLNPAKGPVRLLIGRHRIWNVRLISDTVKSRPCKKYHDIQIIWWYSMPIIKLNHECSFFNLFKVRIFLYALILQVLQHFVHIIELLITNQAFTFQICKNSA